ncbi:helix-turn-helix domain-containing protein [Vibrio fluvialis]
MLYEGGIDGVAERIKLAIRDAGGYEHISEITGISLSTLKRIATGKTDPKFKDVVAITEATEAPLLYIAYGIGSGFEFRFEKMLRDIIRDAQRKGYDTTNLRMMVGMILGSMEAMIDDSKQKKEIEEAKTRLMDLFYGEIIP